MIKHNMELSNSKRLSRTQEEILYLSRFANLDHLKTKVLTAQRSHLCCAQELQPIYKVLDGLKKEEFDAQGD